MHRSSMHCISCSVFCFVCVICIFNISCILQFHGPCVVRSCYCLPKKTKKGLEGPFRLPPAVVAQKRPHHKADFPRRTFVRFCFQLQPGHVASTTHPTNRPASQHVTCVRRGGKGTSQRRDTLSSGLALPSTKPSAASAARANTYMLIISSVRCVSPRHA